MLVSRGHISCLHVSGLHAPKIWICHDVLYLFPIRTGFHFLRELYDILTRLVEFPNGVGNPIVNSIHMKGAWVALAVVKSSPHREVGGPLTIHERAFS